MELALVDEDKPMVVPIGLRWLSDAEGEWLRQALAASADPGSFVELIQSVGAGKTTLYRIIGPGIQGIAATEILERPEGPIFRVWLLGGRGIVTHLRQLYLLLYEVAASFSCKKVIATATPRLAAVYSHRLGFKITAIEVVKEI